MMIKVFGKKLFGVRYEKLTRGLFICVVLFGGLYGSGFNLAIAPFIMYLMTTVLVVCEMWQALSSDENSQNMKNVIMMPFDNKEFVLSYVLSLGMYIFVSRVLPLLAIIIAVAKPGVIVTINTLLCAMSGVILTAVIFAHKKFRILSAIWLASVFALNFMFGTTYYYGAILLTSIIIAMFALIKADAYSFYIGDGKKNQTVKSGKKASVFVYIIRYMKAHKNYLTNTLFFWIVAILIPLSFKEMFKDNADFINMTVPIGFAIMCLNTPIGIILSCDRSLEQAVRFLPGQKKSFCLPYCGFIFVCNLISEIIYIVSCYLQLGCMRKEWIIAVVLYAAQSAIFAVLLEWFFPIRNWQIENDLWKHPRKYVVPGIMIIVSGLIGFAPVVVYGFAALLVIESVYLLVAIQK